MGSHYCHLKLDERRKIESWWHAKVPVREMARVLKRHKSTIYRFAYSKDAQQQRFASHLR